METLPICQTKKNNKFMTDIITFLVEVLVAGAMGVVFTVIRVVGQYMPACGFGIPSLSNDVVTYFVNGVRFWSPLTYWMPWSETWNLFLIWFGYILIKYFFKWFLVICVWIVNLVSKFI